jgi:hypothetical protein
MFGQDHFSFHASGINGFCRIIPGKTGYRLMPETHSGNREDKRNISQ